MSDTTTRTPLALDLDDTEARLERALEHLREARRLEAGGGPLQLPNQRREHLTMYERFTDRARRAIAKSSERARDRGADLITQGDILYGLCEGEGVAHKALSSLGINRSRIGGVQWTNSDAKSPNHIPFTAGAQKAQENAMREALQLGHNFIGTEHLLLGLIRTADKVVDPDLQGFFDEVVHPSRLRQEVIRIITVPEDKPKASVSWEPATAEGKQEPFLGVQYLGTKVVDGRLMFDAADFMSFVRSRDSYRDWEEALERKFGQLVVAHEDEICSTPLGARITEAFGG